MTEPKTIRELYAAFSVYQRMVWTIIGFIGGLIIGAIAIYIQIGELKTDLAVVKANTSNIIERLTGFDKRLGALDDRIAALDRNVQEARADDRVLRAIGRVENQGSRTDPVVAGFYVTAFEATLIIQHLRPPIRTDKPATLSVGSRVNEDRLRPLPEDITLKSARLKGVRYAIDDNNAIALVGPSTDVVFAIL